MISEDLKEDIYKTYLENRVIIFNETIDDSIIEKVVIPIMQINLQDDANPHIDRESCPIHLYINSAGGSALDTLSAVCAIEASRTPVYTYALGKAFSGAFFMLIAGKRRFCQRYSSILYHQVHNTPEGGPQQSIEESLAFTKGLQENFTDLVTRRTKIKKKKIDEVVAKKFDWFISPMEALALDIIDGILV